jgi:trehalose 6-phosphate phosphatase
MFSGPFDFSLIRHISREHQVRSWMWFLDIDGTLLDLASAPDAVVVPGALKAALRRLVSSPSQRVALISGRSLRDVSQLFPHIALSGSGNHGAEFCDGGERWLHPSTEQFMEQHGALLALVAPLSGDYPGLLLEDKLYSLSVHYRHVPEDRREDLALRLRQILDPLAHIQILPAKLCWEVRPSPGPDKGQAVRTLYSRWQNFLPQPSLAVIIGDDKTDEDAFLALPDALSVHVGDGSTNARYRLPNPNAVRSLLTVFSEHLPCLTGQ